MDDKRFEISAADVPWVPSGSLTNVPKVLRQRYRIYDNLKKCSIGIPSIIGTDEYKTLENLCKYLNSSEYIDYTIYNDLLSNYVGVEIDPLKK